ncbi:MAG: fumarylacetoacetate hydrolase family protein [Bryobacterales bacterium]|nr:fumarylacetoacetate hydrolase family protein [Bryobacterales bacterium]
MQFIRYRIAGSAVPQWGRVEGESIQPLDGAPWTNPSEAGALVGLNGVETLRPVEPLKVFAIGMNYRSHLRGRPEPKTPEVFYKPISCLQDPDGPIVLPHNSQDVHFEGELVLVMGRRATRVSVAEAESYLFGVTCGNDVSEREWQRGANKDLQWWRAKGSDTFGPCGPYLVTGLNFNDLLLTTRLNGEVVQQQRTSDLIFTAATMVSVISQNVTLEPGDLIFTGTPGSTRALQAGDVVEVEIEGVGTLKNPVQSAIL